MIDISLPRYLVPDVSRDGHIYQNDRASSIWNIGLNKMRPSNLSSLPKSDPLIIHPRKFQILRISFNPFSFHKWWLKVPLIFNSKRFKRLSYYQTTEKHD